MQSSEETEASEGTVEYKLDKMATSHNGWNKDLLTTGGRPNTSKPIFLDSCLQNYLPYLTISFAWPCSIFLATIVTTITYDCQPV